MNQVADKPLLLQAFSGENRTVPVWFMRQAGRYLPQYRAIKEKYSLNEMFRTPELAAEITCQPIDILGVDAAILFADILTLPQAMGFEITFDNTKGPLISADLEAGTVRDFDDIPHITEIIRLVRERLPARVPLIGFAGSPFTVATYLIEGKSVINHTKTLQYMFRREQQFHQLMERLTQNTIRYAQLQFAAGAQVFQLFDTWAGILRPLDYARFVYPYVQKIFAALELPTIYYIKNTHHLLPLVQRVSADFISVDHSVVLGHDHVLLHSEKGVQGNLYNGLLYAEPEVLRREVNDVLMGGQRYSRYIFNLSHGIFPDVDPDQLKRIVDRVHEFPCSPA